MTTKRRQNRLGKRLYNEGAFFVTICTQDRFCYFGSKVVGAETIRLSTYGEIVKKCRLHIPKIYDDVALADFIIMPNHIHGILYIDDGPKAFTKRPFGYLSKVIKGFKWDSLRDIHQAGFTDFQRQRSFYDHIIRNEEDMQRIQEYIELNPYARENDEYYK